MKKMDHAQVTSKCVETSKCLINKEAGLHDYDLDVTRSIGDIARLAVNIRQAGSLDLEQLASISAAIKQNFTTVRSDSLSTLEDLGRKLQILPLSMDQLSELEKAYNIESKSFIGAFNRDVIEKEDAMFEVLKEKAEPIYDYIRFKYWTDPVQQQITSLVYSEQKINNLSDITDEERLFLQMYILSYLSVSILKFSEPILVIPNKEKEFHVSESLMGGKMESAERRRILETFYEFMVGEISKRYNEKYPISKKDFMSNYYPSYLKYFLDLVERICLKPRVAIHVPRMLDVITYELLLNKKDTNIIDQIFASDNLDLIEVYKLTKDFMTFGERSGFITKERNEYLKDLISKSDS